jgi:hypothetical protein
MKPLEKTPNVTAFKSLSCGALTRAKPFRKQTVYNHAFSSSRLTNVGTLTTQIDVDGIVKRPAFILLCKDKM